MSAKKTKKSYSPETLCVSEFQTLPDQIPHALPIFVTSGFNMDSLRQSLDLFDGKQKGYVYSRYANPTVDAASKKIAALESGNDKTTAIMTSSGMAAISTLMYTILEPGDLVLTHTGLYGGTSELLEIMSRKSGCTLIYADLNDINALNELTKNKKIKAIYFESPSNPLLHCIHIKSLAEFCRNNKIISICDNTICTAYLQQPLEAGVDFVIYSTTKYLSGHGQSTAGCIVSNRARKMGPEITRSVRLLGTNCSPFEAWMVYTGMQTLALRIQRQCENAKIIAAYLHQNSRVKRVYHTSVPDHPHHEMAASQMRDHAPLMSFELVNGIKGVEKFMKNIRLIQHVPTLGDTGSMVLHPDTSSHRNIPKGIKKSIGITPGLIRFSPGIENVEDLLEDLERGI